MKYAIYDACFSESNQAGRGISASYLFWELSRHGIIEYQICEADCVLITCQSTEAVGAIKTIRDRYPGKLLICGGAASTSPYSIGKYCNAVCVGDGQRFLDVLFLNGASEAFKLPNVWVDGDNRRVDIDNNFPWAMPPIQAEDGAYRLWCGRGCKNKCKFCQTGWAYRYSEHPDPDSLVDQARRLIAQGKKIAYLSNDVSQHEFYRQLPSVEHGSYSVNHLKKYGLPPARQIRLGIEGVSERIRHSVGKPISRVDLLGCTKWLNANGKSVRWFMISGLPDETSDDWMELRDTIQEWKLSVLKGVLALSFTAFIPEPATPFASCSINNEYWDHFSSFREWFFGGAGWSNRVKIMNPQQPNARMRKAESATGLNAQQLVSGGSVSPNSRLNYPYKSAKITNE